MSGAALCVGLVNPTSPSKNDPAALVSGAIWAALAFEEFRTNGAEGSCQICPIRPSCEHMRGQARTLNPLARGCPRWTDAKFFLRQCCAPLRYSGSGPVSSALTPKSIP